MGFTQADFEELRINLDRIRFGPRSYRPPPIQLSFLPRIEKPGRLRSKAAKKPPPEPGYDQKYQLRLW